MKEGGGTQGRRIVPVWWQEISLKIPVANTSAARIVRAGTVTLMYVINAFAQVVVPKYTYHRQANTPSCPHVLNSYQVSRYQNWTLSIKINLIFSCVAWFLEITEPWAKYKINGEKSYAFFFLEVYERGVFLSRYISVLHLSTDLLTQLISRG